MKPLPRRAGAWVAALLVLLGVFALYTRPGFLRDMADLVWSCF